MLSGEGGEVKLGEVRRAAEGGVFSGGRVPGEKKNGFIGFKRLANSPQGSGNFRCKGRALGASWGKLQPKARTPSRSEAKS